MRPITMSRLVLSGALAVGAIAVVGGLTPGAATADPSPCVTSEVLLPEGDLTLVHDAPFQDIVRARLTKTASGDFKLLMEMAVAIPDAPPMPPAGKKEIWWLWAFGLSPEPVPNGYPWNEVGSQVHARPADFLVRVSWDGTHFAAAAIDRRPLRTAGEAIVTPVPFDIDGRVVTADLSSGVIGEVSASFWWWEGTLNWSGQVGTEGCRWADHPNFSTVINP
jgi:hypothetical protein